MRTLFACLSVALLVAGCSSPADDTGPGCVPDQCLIDCLAAGYAGGSCYGGLCSCSDPGDGGGDADADADPDGGDGTGADADADADGGEVDPCAPPSCGPTELCGESGSGNGVDDDCNGRVDEICPCGAMGTTLECFPDDPAICPPGMPCRGACTRGVEYCSEFGTWSDCTEAVTPADEICDGSDNDCDGLVDEDLTGCDVPVTCPATRLAAPMTWVPLDGSSIYAGTYDSWLWELFCPVTVPTCPAPEDPAARDTRVLIISSGTYRARATIRSAADTWTCEFALVAQGSGLRVELLWDSQGSAHGDTDVDLHLHQWGATSSFFASPQDCYYANCKGSSCCWDGPPEVDWGLAHTTDLGACRDAPQGEGAEWETLGFCANPRLDVDVIYCETGITDPSDWSFCAPENINVDNPPVRQPMRIMVNYYSDHGYTPATTATVNVYCGGALRATFEEVLRNGTSYGSSNDNWIVADVQFYEGICGVYDCEIVPVGVVQMGDAFGPAWSTFSH